MKAKILTQEQFVSSREPWSNLLENSIANRVFLSWEWQFTWWKSYSSSLNAELAIIAVLDEHNKWLGLAPLYVSRHSYGSGLVQSRVLHPIGGVWRKDFGFVSEYLDFIIRIGTNKSKVRNVLLDVVFDSLEWDEFAYSYMPANSESLRDLTRKAANRKFVCSVENRRAAYSISLERGFDAFKFGLSGNARRAMFSISNDVENWNYKVPSASGDDVSMCKQWLDDLSELQKRRFGKTSLGNETKEFFRHLSTLRKSSLKVLVSYYRDVAGAPVSVTIDVAARDEAYNLLTAFHLTAKNSISLGLIHLGKNTEAYSQSGVKRYDLLAGGGKQNSRYKEQITNAQTEMVDVRIIRSSRLKILYRLRPRAILKTFANGHQ